MTEITKGTTKFWGRWNIDYLECGYGFMDLYIYQNITLCTLCLLYAYYIAIKLFKKRKKRKSYKKQRAYGIICILIF